MGEITVKPISNVFKKYKSVIYVNPYLLDAPVIVAPENTFIGGVSDTLYTPELLAAKLSISVSRISHFSVLGNDIKCKITGEYVIPITCFSGNASITSFVDSDNLVTDIKGGAFRDCPKLKGSLYFGGVVILTGSGGEIFSNSGITDVIMPNLTSISNNAAIFALSSNLRTFYAPNLTTIGTSTGSNAVFSNYARTQHSLRIYVNPYMQTSNSGALEGDLQELINLKGSVSFVTNFNKPNPVTTLSAGTVLKSAIQLNFSPPSSLNLIDYYECYANGKLMNRIKSSGEYITGLSASTSYNITIVAVDIFYNKSLVSNSVSASTNSVSALSTLGLISYYKLDSNSIDSVSSNNGVDTSVTYSSGKLGNCAIYNGTSSKTVVGNPNNLKLSQGTISVWVKTLNPGSSFRSIFGKILAYNLFMENSILGVYSWAGSPGYRTTNINITDGIWHHLAFVFESGTNLNYLYLDGVLVLTTSVTILDQTDNVCIGASNSVQNFNGSIEEASIHSQKLTASQVNLLYNNGLGVTL